MPEKGVRQHRGNQMDPSDCNHLGAPAISMYMHPETFQKRFLEPHSPGRQNINISSIPGTAVEISMGPAECLRYVYSCNGFGYSHIGDTTDDYLHQKMMHLCKVRTQTSSIAANSILLLFLSRLRSRALLRSSSMALRRRMACRKEEDSTPLKGCYII